MTNENNYNNIIKSGKNIFQTYKAEIGITILILYTILLAIATIAELFEIQPILDWWIFRPPGK